MLFKMNIECQSYYCPPCPDIHSFHRCNKRKSGEEGGEPRQSFAVLPRAGPGSTACSHGDPYKTVSIWKRLLTSPIQKSHPKPDCILCLTQHTSAFLLADTACRPAPYQGPGWQHPPCTFRWFLHPRRRVLERGTAGTEWHAAHRALEGEWEPQGSSWSQVALGIPAGPPAIILHD